MGIGDYEELTVDSGITWQLCNAYGALTELQQVAFGMLGGERLNKVKDAIEAGEDTAAAEAEIMKELEQEALEGGAFVESFGKMCKMLAIVIRGYKEKGQETWEKIGSVGPTGNNARFAWCYEFMPLEDGTEIVQHVMAWLGDFAKGVKEQGKLKASLGLEHKEAPSQQIESSPALVEHPSSE